MHAIDAADRVHVVFNPDYSWNLEIPRHHWWMLQWWMHENLAPDEVVKMKCTKTINRSLQ